MMRVARSLILALFALALLPSLAAASPMTGDSLGLSWFVVASVALGLGLLLGTGIMPSGAAGTELNAVTRRAYVPKNVVQIYKASPILGAALANAQPASGGVSSITVPVQGTPMTAAQATDYSGTFTAPSALQGITEADFNLKCVIVPIQFLGMEGIVQDGAAVIPLLEARMNDAGNQIADYLATQMMTNNVNGSVNIDGFPLMAATTGSYGNISRTANSWWQGKTRTASATTPSRITVMQDILAAAKAAGGEFPNIGFMGIGTWSKLAADFIGSENYRVTPGTAFSRETQGVEGTFTALSIAGVSIYPDLYSPEQQLILANTRYCSFYIHEAAAFAFTGFASTLPNMQLGYVGALVVVLEFVNVKPQSLELVTTYSTIDSL
jgi:hypothetical protein